MIVIINIPAIHINSRLELFQIHNLPFPGKGEFQSSIAQYEKMATGLALNSKRTEYVLLNKQDFMMCSSDTELFCKLNNVRYMIGAKMHCESALFMADNESMQQNCKTMVSSEVPLPMPVNINNRWWAISTKDNFSITVSCNSQMVKSVIIKTPLTLFQLNKSCIASSTYFTIPARQTFTSKLKVLSKGPSIDKIHIGNTSHWESIEKTITPKPVKKILTKLGKLKSFPMNRLISELGQIHDTSFSKGYDGRSHWYIAITCTVVIVVIMFFILIMRWKGISNWKKNNKNVKHETECIEMKPNVFLNGDDCAG